MTLVEELWILLPKSTLPVPKRVTCYAKPPY